MAHLAKLNGVFQTLPIKPKLFNTRKARRSTMILGLGINKTEEFREHKVQSPTAKSNSASLHATRRVVLGLSAIILSARSGNGISLAEDNGFWIIGPLPVPPVFNKIANEETGTRSFLKKGVYIANIGTKGSAYRLRKYAFELMGLGDLIGQDAWNYVRQYLRQKSTIMYYDFDNVISAAPIEDKQSLTDLANRLFDNVEKLEDAVRKHNLPQTESCYQDTTALLQEVRNRMA